MENQLTSLERKIDDLLANMDQSEEQQHPEEDQSASPKAASKHKSDPAE